MPSGWAAWLRTLGGLLPARLRQYVFEPACYDLVQDALRRRRGTRLIALRLFGILLHVALVNFPRVLIEDRRPSRLAVVLGGVALTGLLALTTLVLMMRASYG